MIDVTFLLLVFFLFAFRFPTLEGKLSAYLPADVHDSLDFGSVERVEVKLEVVRPGRRMDPSEPTKPWGEQPGTRFVFDDTREVRYSIGPRKTLELSELRDRLEELRRASGERSVTIDARAGIVYDEVTEVIDAALDAGYERVLFVGSYE